MPRHCATRPRWRRRNCCWWRPTRRSSPRCHTGASRTGRPWPPTPCGRWPLSSSCRSARCARSSPQPVSGCSAAGEQRGERLMDRAAGAALLGPAEIREIAQRLGVRPSKRLGQNFVVDPGTVRRIVALAGLGPDDVVLEVGPGFGSLTLGLLGAAGQVVAVEVDPALAAELPGTVAARAPEQAGRLTVVTADAARVTPADLDRAIGTTSLPGPAVLPGGGPSALVANLPYSVAVPVLLHLLAAVPSLARGLVMVQAEVADRMTAPPGSRIYGVPSVKLAWYASARRTGQVS